MGWFDTHEPGSPVPITYNDRSNANVGLQTLPLHQFERSMPRLRELSIGFSLKSPSHFELRALPLGLTEKNTI
jgi:hypothetical protein